MAFMSSSYLTTLSLVLYLVVLSGNLDKCCFTEATKHETVIGRLGSNVTLPCENIGNSTNDGKLWIYNNMSILYSGHSRYAPENLANVKFDGNGSLLIENFEKKNEASYVCKSGSKLILNRYVVFIEVLPTLSMKFPQKLRNGSNEYQVSSQQSYQIECNATGSNHNVSISWAINNRTYIGRERVTSITGDNNTIHTESVILYLPNIDDREISCRATGQTNSFVVEQLTVSVCDETPKQLVSISAKYGDTLTLSCEASEKMAIWDFPIRENRKTRNEGEILHIYSVKVENEGEYKCHKAGETTVATSLTVQVIPKLAMSVGDEEGFLHNVTVFTHKLYKVHCSSMQTRPPARISWKINNKNYDIGLKTLNRTNKIDADTLDYHSTIFFIPMRDTNISCTARGHHSGMEWTTSLFIETFEKSLELSYNISVFYGNNISFCCDYVQKDDILWTFGKNYDHLLPSMHLEGVTEFKTSGFNGTESSCLYVVDTKKTHEGRYTCYRLNELAVKFLLDVKVTPNVEIIFEGNPDLNKVAVYRFKSYLVRCLVTGAYPPFTILWKINGIGIVNGVFNESSKRYGNAADLFDSTSRLEYQPNENDRNITCIVMNSHGSCTESTTHIREVITFDEEVETKHLLHGSNVNLRCKYSNAVEKFHWFFDSIRITFVERKCNHPNIVGITSTGNETMISITNLNAGNEGRYSCYHGLEKIKIIHVTMKVQLGVYLMPGIKRLYPDTVEFYEGSQYILVCIANSTDDISSLQWQVNGVYVSRDVFTTTVNSSLTVRQLIPQYHYTSVISHLTISCVAEGEDETIVTQMVKIHLVLSFRKKVILLGGASLFLIILAVILVLICRCCCMCTRKKSMDNDDSTELRLREKGNEFRNVDTAVWRKAMNAFAERSSRSYGLLRRSRMPSETSSSNYEETGEMYDRFISRSFGSSFVPFWRLSFVIQLKSGSFKDRWMGKLRERTSIKTGTYISAVSEDVTEDYKYRWDMFVKNVINIPFSRHIARILGVSMQNERLYLLQEFLTVQNLKTYLQENMTLLISDRQVSKNILRITRGVIDGMYFLAHHKFCHPALSTNKILIGNDDECKLYDFCLLKDASDKIESIKLKRKASFSNLAKETILHGEFTILSDVWSLGTALWEIFSLGNEPFKELHQEDIRRLMQRGYQLPQPARCSKQFYHVMLNCWVDSTERPTLSTIREKLETAIQEYIAMSHASIREINGTNVSTNDTLASVTDTYGYTGHSSRRREEDIYEQMS